MSPATPNDPGTPPYAVEESAVHLVLNDVPTACFHCTPQSVEEMVLGWLLGEGLAATAVEVESIVVADDLRTVSARLANSPGLSLVGAGALAGCERWTDPAEIPREAERASAAITRLCSDRAGLRPLFAAMFERAKLRETGGGIHTGALVVDGEVQLVVEDVGRHNLVDKIVGLAVRAGMPLQESIVLLSARVSGAIALKLWRTGVPAVATISVPTTMAREITARCGITIVGRSLKQNPHLYSVTG